MTMGETAGEGTGRRSMPLLGMTRTRGVECAMWLYGAGMMAWMFAVILGTGGVGGTPLSSLAAVFAVWTIGTLPAYLVAVLATRSLPGA